MTYVICNDTGMDEERGSTIYGPFASAAEADAFADSFPIEPLDGGYTHCFVIRPGEQHCTPPDAWWWTDDEADD